MTSAPPGEHVPSGGGLTAAEPVVERASLRLAGHEVVVQRWVPGSGGRGEPPVVLVHGIGVSGRYFEPLARALAADGPVLVPDLPGFGASPRGPEPLEVAEHARVLAELVRAEGLDRPVLVGHSMGAQVVTETAVQEPGLARGIVLIGPVVEPGARSALRQGWRLARDARHETARANLLMLTDWFRTGPRWYFATVPHMLAYPLEERLPLVREPVLVVRGRKDPVAPPAYVRRLASLAPRGAAAEMAGEGHIVMMRRPGVAAALVRSVG